MEQFVLFSSDKEASVLIWSNFSFLYPNSVSSDMLNLHVWSGTVMLMPEVLVECAHSDKLKVAKEYEKPWHSAQYLFLYTNPSAITLTSLLKSFPLQRLAYGECLFFTVSNCWDLIHR